MRLILHVPVHGATFMRVAVEVMDIDTVTRTMAGRGRVVMNDGVVWDVLNIDTVIEALTLDLEAES